METIKTLDGKVWNKSELLKMMLNDEFYYGYLGENSLSSSSVKNLKTSPKKYAKSLKEGNKRTSAMTLGWLLHLAVFEMDKFTKLNFIDVSTRNTKVYKQAFSENPMTFLRSEYDEVMRLSDAVYNNNDAAQLIEGLEYEVPAIGNIFGYPFRGKADALNRGEMIVDLKTTTDVAEFERAMYNFDYGAQVYIYTHLFELDSYKDFYFLCVDKNTYDVGIVEFETDRHYFRGEQIVERAIENYQKYLQGVEALNNDTIRITL